MQQIAWGEWQRVGALAARLSYSQTLQYAMTHQPVILIKVSQCKDSQSVFVRPRSGLASVSLPGGYDPAVLCTQFVKRNIGSATAGSSLQ